MVKKETEKTSECFESETSLEKKKVKTSCSRRIIETRMAKGELQGSQKLFCTDRIVSFRNTNMLIGYFCRVFLEVFENFKFEVA